MAGISTNAPGPENLPTIRLAFSGYVPRDDVRAMVQDMLASVPAKYLMGLSEIVLTNSGALPRARRRGVTKSRGKKVQVKATRGLYHPAFHNRLAWIEIFVDSTFRNWETRWLPLRWLRKMEMCDILFHELGHHIHYTVRPEYRETEDVADIWKVRLENNYRRQHHFWLRKLLNFLRVGSLIKRGYAHERAWSFKKGYISRAEYEESMRNRRSDEPSIL